MDRPPRSKEVTLNYRVSRLVHKLAFTRGHGLWGLMRRLFARWDKKPGVGPLDLRHGTRLEAPALRLPGLRRLQPAELAYLCPRHSCSKSSRNGPCGGSAAGRCELADKECFWARVYERLKSYGESEAMLDRLPVFYNAQLKDTSSWANFYLDRDQVAREPKRRARSKHRLVASGWWNAGGCVPAGS